MKRKALGILLFMLGMALPSLSAQNVGIKTNLLYDALLNANIGAEVGVAPKWSVDLSADVNFWNLSHDRKWKHWFVQPEARYWFCEAFNGHFVGAHLLGGQYNMGNFDFPFSLPGLNRHELRDNRRQGWAVGAGVAYGYSWLLGRHWNIEAEIGVGYLFTKYDVYECAGCGRKTQEGVKKNYLGPTKAAVNLIYVF